MGESEPLAINQEVGHDVFVVLNAVIEKRGFLNGGHTGVVL